MYSVLGDVPAAEIVLWADKLFFFTTLLLLLLLLLVFLPFYSDTQPTSFTSGINVVVLYRWWR
jgi:hypothetical protein